MLLETRKILHEPDLKISATTVRVPVFRSHSESVNIETERKLTPGAARAILAGAPGSGGRRRSGGIEVPDAICLLQTATRYLSGGFGRTCRATRD